jgi:hypothetical protein
MKHSRGGITVVRHRLLTLVTRQNESDPSSDVGVTQQSPVASHKMPSPAVTAAIVVTIVGLLAIACKCFI